MFKERFLLLTNDSALGVFNQDRKTVYIALSNNGEFVKVYEGDSSFIHLTRFCPVSVYPLVQKLLNFRNQYAHRPYLSERFLKTSSPFNGSRTISWRQETQQQTTKNFWKVYSNGDERSLIAVCPHRKKMCYLSDAIFLPASPMSHHQAQLSSEFRVTRLVTVVPFAHAPTFFQRNYDKNSGLGSANFSMLGANIMTEIPTSIECGASDSSSACHFFQEIEHELAFLKSDKKYPTSADFAVKIEIIDGEIFLFTQCDLTTGEQSQDIIVESWIQPPRERRIINRNTLSSTQMDVAYVEEEGEGCNMSAADFGCNGGGPILTLNGDYFIFYHDQYTSSGGTDVSHENDHSMTGVSIHISLIEQTCQEMENAKFGTHAQSYNENVSENNSENWVGSETSKDNRKKTWCPNHNISNSSNSAQEILSTSGLRRSDLKSEVEINVGEDDSSLQIQNILRRYRQHAIHLLEYRQYLQVRKKHLDASSYTPHCLKSIGGDKMKTGINHFSRDRAIRAVAGRQEHRQGQGQGYGGSYYVKNLELHEVFCDNADSRISSASRSNRHSSDIDRNSNSLHNDNCSDSNPSNAHQCVKLQTSDGTRFTAYPNSEAALDMQKFLSAKSYGNMITDEYGLACMHSELDFYEVMRDHADQHEYKKNIGGTYNNSDQGMFCRVRGVFPDRTQLDLCLKSKVWYRVLSTVAQYFEIYLAITVPFIIFPLLFSI